MHTYSGLWESIISIDNLYEAYAEARKGKRYTVQATMFSENLEENMITLYNELSWLAWRPEPMRQFIVREPKPRQISAPTFRDRVVHHALVRIIEPLFERKFIDHSYACRKGRGTHAAVHHVQSEIRKTTGKAYVLKGDIKSYFSSVNHDVLKRILRRTIRDKKTLWLLDTIIDAFGPGVPIGSLTSQLFANIVLDQLDHYVIDELGWGRKYTRYMDDFVIVGNGRAQLRSAERMIWHYVETELCLRLNEKTRVITAEGLDFCGYRIWPHHLKPRKRNTKRARKRLRGLAVVVTRTGNLEPFKATLMSFLGYMKQCKGYLTTKSILGNAVIGREK